MDEQKQQLIDRIRQAQNILVTVSTNPNVDQLSAAIGLTIALNKLDKHGTAVFSGEVPSTIDFLKPEDTLEKNTDSLRDFIIALDKSKADKLRYKVEDQVVRIFITPYKTSLSQSDLDFSQGDFNVDVVVALGVTEQQDLDVAITSHGRILHDATVVSVSTQGQGSLGTINWVDPGASSLSEMVVSLVDGLDKKLIDGQIATALLTGIVAGTERFSNDKTSPKTMSASAELMAAGANQQLIATELEAPTQMPVAQSNQQNSAASDIVDAAPKAEPGTLEIDHDGTDADEPITEGPAPEPPRPQVHVDEDGLLHNLDDGQLPEISRVRGIGTDGSVTESGSGEVKRERMLEPPSLTNDGLTANSSPEVLDPGSEELTLPSAESPMLSHTESVLPSTNKVEIEQMPAAQVFTPTPPPVPQPAPTDWQLPALPTPPQAASGLPPLAPDTTLTEIERSVGSPHLAAADSPFAATPDVSHVDDARSAVEAAYSSPVAPSDPLQPIAALNAQPLGPDLRDEALLPPAPAPFTPPMPPAPTTVSNTGFSEPTPGNTPADDALDMPLPSNPFGPGQTAAPSSFTPPPAPFTPPSSFPGVPQQGSAVPSGQTPPPPVPPPMLPPLQ